MAQHPQSKAKCCERCAPSPTHPATRHARAQDKKKTKYKTNDVNTWRPDAHTHIKVLVRGLDMLHHGLDRSQVTLIAAHALHSATSPSLSGDGLSSGCCRCSLASTDDHLGTTLGECHGQRTTDASGATRDQHMTPLQRPLTERGVRRAGTSRVNRLRFFP